MQDTKMITNKTCRTCLTIHTDMRIIFDEYLHEKIMECASIKIFENDGLSNLICKECVYNANKAYSFKKQCEETDRNLRKSLFIIDDVKVDIKQEDDVRSIDFELLENDSHESEIPIKNEDIVCKNEVQLHENIDSKLFKNQNIPKLKKCRKKGFSRKKHIQLKEDIKQNKTDTNGVNVKNEIINESKIDIINSDIDQDDTTCWVCHRIFPDTKQLKIHKRVHKPKNHKCDICNRTFYGPTDLKHHIRTHTGEKPLKCTECEKKFSDPRGLKSHMKIHTGEKPYECDVCKKRFRFSYVLKTHRSTHIIPRPYVCATCGKTFIYSHNLQIHMRGAHTGERPYACTTNGCSKRFTSGAALYAHMITHTGEKRFVCTECGLKVARKGDLAVHMRIHTGEKPYQCTLCPKKYSRSNHLQEHMKRHTGEKNYSCTKCDESFSVERFLKRHMKKH